MKEKDIIICGHGSGNPSTKILSTYAETRYNSFAKNGKRKGIVAVKRFKGLNTKELRTKFHDKYKTILGRNIYDQGLRGFCYKPYKGKYYSDCSSSGCLTLAEIGLKVSALNTAGIYNSKLFEDVKVNIVKGHITNPEVLEVGDAILFVGNDPSRPKQIGHVEWVYEKHDESDNDKIKVGVSNKQDVAPYKAKVKCDELNVRKTPGNGTVIKVLKKDQVVTVKKICLYTDSEGRKTGWGYVPYFAGWIALSYTEQKKTYYEITADSLHFREDAPDGKILDVLHKGDKVHVVDTRTIDGKLWGKGIFKGVSGWFRISNYAVQR